MIESRFLVWAAGEFQFPNLNIFKGAEFCLHNSEVRSWSDLEGDEFYIIGGFESGMDAAFNLSSLGKKVNVLDRQSPWNDRDTDPSLNLSPYTLERLREEYKNGRINLFEDTDIKNIEEKGESQIIEIGPGKVLSGLIKRISNKFDIISINNIQDLEQLKKL